MTREEEIQKLIAEETGIVNYGSADYQVGVCDGVRLADKNPNSQTIAEYLFKEKGYPISLNGEIPTFEETMKDAQVYNVYKTKQLIEKACDWLREQKEMIGIAFQDDFIERFKIAMQADCESGFINDSKLVDKYLANVWHDVSEEPSKYKHILFKYISKQRELEYFAQYVTKNTYGTLQEFEKFGKCRWAYISDLLPKGGEE